MKIIVENSTLIVKFLLEDTVPVVQTENDTKLTFTKTVEDVEYSVITNVSQFNLNNSTVIENVEAPEEFLPNKYFYKEGAYQLNSEWKAPDTESFKTV